MSIIQCQVEEPNLVTNVAIRTNSNGPCLCVSSLSGLGPSHCQGASRSLMGSVLEGRDVRFSRLRPCHPHLLLMCGSGLAFLGVEVELELGTLLQGGIREFGAQLSSIASSHQIVPTPGTFRERFKHRCKASRMWEELT